MPKPERIRLAYELTFATPFHFGTGIREGLIDRTVVRDAQGNLYVPGSTFKGVLRERCEQLARFFAADKAAKDQITSPHDRVAAIAELGQQRESMITRIFGSQMRPAQLFFDDARLPSELIPRVSTPDENAQLSDAEKAEQKRLTKQAQRLQVSEQTQVRLDRPTRTAVQGALYISEFGTYDLRFQGLIQGWLACTQIDPDLHASFQQKELAPTYSLLLLLAGLRLLDRLGGNRSTGKGQCQCTITSLKLANQECPKELWQSWLEQIEVLDFYGDLEEEGR